MGISQHLVKLEALAAIDGEIKELVGGIDKERNELDDVRTEMEGLVERLQADRDSVAEMEKTRTDLMQELRQIAGQIDRSRERLQRARNERESNAAERELDELRKIQRDRDDEIKKLQELCDQARITIGDNDKRREELATRLEGSLEGTTKIIADLEGHLAKKNEKRKTLTTTLPRRVFLRYERLWERGKVPIAKTHDGTCLGCFVKLPPMMFHTMLSQMEFEECPNCHRIIYYVPPPPPEEEKAKEDAEPGDSVVEQASGEASS